MSYRLRTRGRTATASICSVLLLLAATAAAAVCASSEAQAGPLRYDLFVRSFESGGALHRIHGETGAVIYSDPGFAGFYVTTGTDGQVYLDRSGSIVRVDPNFDGGFCPSCVENVGRTVPAVGVTIGPDGAFYAVSSQRIIRTDFEGFDIPRLFGQAGAGVVGGFEAIVFGPDGDLYANDGAFTVFRFDGTTGAFLGQFASAPRLSGTRGMAFGDDGYLYVSGVASDNVVRFDAASGAFVDVFATGIDGANGLAFGPDGDLYVVSEIDRKIVRVDGTTGALLGDFATGLSGIPVGITFAPVPEPASCLLAVCGVWFGLPRGRRAVLPARS